MSKKVEIETLNENHRLSTQELLELIYKKIDEGFTEFEIDACGQHNIGGSLWSPDSNNEGGLTFKVKNPGQRVGSMGMEGTTIIVEGSAPADVGWLNTGAEIIVKGDGGDTTAHCSASGKIYVGGRTGTRSGALMKYDPKFVPPEFWVLRNTGSFSFEFMGGGVAIICGHNCEDLDSVLGFRPCVGMVGGTIFFRGNCSDLSPTVKITSLSPNDIEFLVDGMKDFLGKVERPELFKELTDFSQWKKIEAKPFEERSKKTRPQLKAFRNEEWVEGGIFGDLIQDDYKVYGISDVAVARLRAPVWHNGERLPAREQESVQVKRQRCCDCKICINNCPEKAIKRIEKDNIFEYIVDDEKCIGCGICEGVCPFGIWVMENNIQEIN